MSFWVLEPNASHLVFYFLCLPEVKVFLLTIVGARNCQTATRSGWQGVVSWIEKKKNILSKSSITEKKTKHKIKTRNDREVHWSFRSTSGPWVPALWWRGCLGKSPIHEWRQVVSPWGAYGTAKTPSCNSHFYCLSHKAHPVFV